LPAEQDRAGVDPVDHLHAAIVHGANLDRLQHASPGRLHVHLCASGAIRAQARFRNDNNVGV
jgi:hypothetical protein